PKVEIVSFNEGQDLQYKLAVDLRQHLDGELVLEILAFVEGDDLDLGLERGAKIALAHRFGGAVRDRALQHFADNGRTIALAQDVQRHFAGPKPGQPNAASDFIEPVGDAPFDIGGLDHDGHFVLEPFGGGLGDLHNV